MAEEVFEIEFKRGRFQRVGYNLGRWSGIIIQLTKDCSGCPCFRKAKVVRQDSIDPSDDNTDKVKGVCVWGVAWKVLYETDKPRICSKERKQVSFKSSSGRQISFHADLKRGAP